MKKLAADIKNKTFENIYLLYGDEGYLIREYKKRLIKSITDGDGLNTSKYEGSKIEVKDLIDDINAAPFFADYRLIVVEDSKFFKKAEDELVEALSNVPESTIIIFAEREVDKRGRMFKTVSKNGYACEMGFLKDADLEKWIAKNIANNDKKITQKTLDLFLSMTDGNLFMIKNELDKVFSYVGERDVITDEDVLAVCDRPIVGKIFDMTDAMSQKNKKKCIDLYYDLIAAKEAPTQILYMLSRQFYLLLTAKELKAKGYGNSQIASEMAVRPFVVNKLLGQSSNFELKTLKKAFRESVVMAKKSRSGLIDEKIAIEQILIKYSE